MSPFGAPPPMKPYLLYIILAWQAGPLLPQEQKTILVQFDSRTECVSVGNQIIEQVKAAKSIFFLKEITCRRCTDILTKDRCNAR